MEYMSEEGYNKILAELQYLETVELPRVRDAISEARDQGDLSENFEYKCAKQAKNRNESRIRYLERMIRTAKVIEVKGQDDAVGLFDKVTVFNEMVKKEMTVQIVTTLRQDALKGLISKESPVGKALMGHKVGERVQVEIDQTRKYFMEIKAIEKGFDDESLDISAY